MARIPSGEDWQCFQKLSATEMRKSLSRMGYLVYQGLAWRSHLLSYIQLWWHPCRLTWDYSQANDIVAWLVSEIFYPILFYRTLKMLSCILQKETIAFHKMAKSEATTFSGLMMIQTLTLQLLFRKRPRGLLRETLSFSFRNVMLQSENTEFNYVCAYFSDIGAY